MARIVLTDITIKNLKSDTQTRYWDAALPGFGILVGKKRKTFIVMRGKKRKIFTVGAFPKMSLAEARRKAGTLLDDPEITAREAPPTVSQCVTDYLAHLDASPRWIKEQERLFRNHVFPLHEDARVDRFTTQHILAITDALKTRAPSEALHVHKAVRALYNWLIMRRVVAASPLSGLVLPVTEKSRDRVLTDKELRAVYAAAVTMAFPFGYIVLLCIHCAFRINETSRLKWSHITPEHITLPAHMTKNKQEHVLPNLVANNLALIPQTSEYLFPSAVGTPFSAWSKNKILIDERSGVTDWRLHDLRRTAASKMAEWRCGQPHVIERILNHVTGAMTPLARTYNRHSYLAEMRECLDLYEQRLAILISSA
jgi:integrase